MFAWRKPKPADDEPLVPHGMIWQATEDPMPAEAVKTDPVAQKSDSQISASLKDSSPATKLPESADIRPEIIDASAPLPWASMNVEGAVKRPPPFLDANADMKTPPAIPVAAQDSAAKSSSATANLAAGRARDTEDANRSTTRGAAFKQFAAERKQELHAAWCELTHVIAEGFANTRHAYTNWQIRDRVRRTREQAQAKLFESIAHVARQTAKPGDVAERNASPRIASGLAIARDAALLIQNRAAAAMADSRKSARSLMNRRVRVRIAAGSQLRPYVASLQARSRTILTRNSRLVTSLAMAGLSALLTLGLIIVVGRYQPSASASSAAITSTPQPGAVSIPARPIAAKPSPTRGAHTAAGKKQAPIVNAALRTPVHSAAPPKPASARRPHHNPDEDYVAPDTYVYYGKKR